MNNQLAHIFDNSVCLTKRQLRDYVSGHMSSEESHALELHLNSCPLCSEAVEGLQLHPEETVAMLHEMTGDFLQEHFAFHTPHVHLNSMAPAASMSVSHKKKNKVQPLWRNASIAAAILLSFGLMWYLQSGREKNAPMQRGVAQNKPATAQQTEENRIAAATPVADDMNDETAPAAATTGNQNQQNGGNSSKPQLLISGEKHTADKGPENKDVATVAAEPAADRQAMTETQNSIASAAPAPTVVEGTETNKSVAAARTQQTLLAPPQAAKKESSSTVADKKYKTAKSADESQTADEAYNNGNYTAALNQYSKDIDNTDEGRRHAAMLGAANSYVQLGQKDKAIALLQKIISEGGAEKHKAKALLRKLNNSQQ